MLPESTLDLSRRAIPSRRAGSDDSTGHFLMKALPSIGIASGHELLEEQLIVASAGEIAAASEHQGLVDGLLEAVMTLLEVAILVGLSRLDRLAFEPVMGEQSPVASGEQLGFGVAVDRRGQAIGAGNGTRAWVRRASSRPDRDATRKLTGGASADYSTLYQEFGFTAEAVVAAAEESIAAAG